MNTYKSKNKILATIIAILLFASIMLVAMPQANAQGLSGTITHVNSVAVSAPYNVSPGDEVTISVIGMTPGARVNVYWGNVESARIGTALLSGTATTATVNVTIPDAPFSTTAGIILRDESLSTMAQYMIPVNVVPSLTVNPLTALPNDSVTISGKGFHASTSSTTTTVTVTIPFTPTAVTATATTNSNGSFSVNIRVPTGTPYNSYTVTATDNGSPVASETATLTIGATIAISPSSGPVGTRITISGRGFQPGEIIDVNDMTLIHTGGTVGAVANVSNPVTVNAAGQFTISAIITAGTRNYNTLTVDPQIGAALSSTGPVPGTFRITPTTGTPDPSQPRITTDKPAGQPTTTSPSVSLGDSITVTGTNFAQAAGTNVSLILRDPAGVLPDVLLTNPTPATTTSSGTFSYTFTIPAINTGLYDIIAEDDYGITATHEFGVTITWVALFSGSMPVTSALSTGSIVYIRGGGFDVFGTTYIANVTISGNILPNGRNVGHSTVAISGVEAVIGVDGSTLTPGTYTVTITTDEGLTASTQITVTDVATVTITPQVAPRDSVLNVTGVGFTPNAAVTVEVRNASTNALVDIINVGSTDATGRFSALSNKASVISATFALGDYIINATDNRGVTAETTLTVAKVSITIDLGANSYAQGDIATLQLTSNTAPTGFIDVYDSSGALVTRIELETGKWIQTSSGSYVYQQSQAGGVPSGALIQIASDARLGAWTWNSTINDANEPQKYNGGFTVTTKNAASSPPASSPPASSPPASSPPASSPPASSPPASSPPASSPPASTDEPDSGGRNWNTIIIVIAVIALIVGVIAVFLFYTMRRKIAN